MSLLDPPKSLLRSKRRRLMWDRSKALLEVLSKVLPITRIELLGSFTTAKKRPADVDVIVLLRLPVPDEDWSLDLVFTPDGKAGQAVFDDAKKWMRQKYGKGNFVQMTILPGS